MKRIAPIALLILLLYHMLGISFAVLCFEKDYQVASVPSAATDQKLIKLYHPSLPYSNEIEISGELQGLIRTGDQFYNPVNVRHTNDTLYITLQSNQGARDRFFELAGAMQSMTDTQASVPQNPYSKAVKLFNILLKTYIPAGALQFNMPSQLSDAPVLSINTPKPVTYLSHEALLSTPPPEHC